jgi:DNA-binding MarR family transcriptional regulator
MTTDCHFPPSGGWRSARTPRDPIGQRLKAISMLTRQIGRRIGENLGVNVTDMAALEQLLNNGPMTPSQMADHLKVTTAAATQIVDRLERAGHVSRERRANDRRKIFIVPVEASVDRAFEQLAPMLDGLAGVIADLTPTDRQVIEGFLDQVLGVYGALADAPPAETDPKPGATNDDPPPSPVASSGVR